MWESWYSRRVDDGGNHRQEQPPEGGWSCMYCMHANRSELGGEMGAISPLRKSRHKGGRMPLQLAEDGHHIGVAVETKHNDGDCKQRPQVPLDKPLHMLKVGFPAHQLDFTCTLNPWVLSHKCRHCTIQTCNPIQHTGVPFGGGGWGGVGLESRISWQQAILEAWCS